MTLPLLRAERDLSTHPCFYGPSLARWGRVHLPVAGNCNVQCNFCNRLYDCVNENRPAVTRGVLDPSFAVAHLDSILAKRSDIAVAGIAGPGDPMAEPEATLDTIRRVRARYPGLLLCLSTNGLNLLPYVDTLARLGVTHVTVTVNAVHPAVAALVYRWVRLGGRLYRGRDAGEILFEKQGAAIVRLKEQGLVVKMNTVVIPGVNSDHVGDIAREGARLGVDIMNCIPMIPVPGTPFSSFREPGTGEMERVRAMAAPYIPQMTHCRRCRADAVGLLHEEDNTGTPCERTRSAGAMESGCLFP